MFATNLYLSQIIPMPYDIHISKSFLEKQGTDRFNFNFMLLLRVITLGDQPLIKLKVVKKALEQ